MIGKIKQTSQYIELRGKKIKIINQHDFLTNSTIIEIELLEKTNSLAVGSRIKIEKYNIEQR